MMMRERASGLGRTSDFEEDIKTLHNFYFISNIASDGMWTMHKLVQDATQVWLKDRGKFEEVHDQLCIVLTFNSRADVRELVRMQDTLPAR